MSNPTFSAKKITSYRVIDPKDIQVANEKTLKDWTCFCGKLVFKPRICNKCHYVCCKDCIIKFMKECNNRYKCPIKCENTFFRKLNITEKRYINNIKLRCKHEGCNKFIEYTDYEVHLEKCEKRLYQCNNHPCESQGIREQMEKHSKICKYRMVSCNLCNEKIKYIDKEDHYSENCMEILVKCPFCGIFEKRKEYNRTHKSDDAKCLKDLVEIKNKKINEYEAEIKRLKSENYNLRNEIKDNKNLIEEKNKEIKELTKSKNDLIKKNNDKRKTIRDLKEYFKNSINKLNEDDDESEQVLNINNEIKKKANQNNYLKIETGRNTTNNYTSNGQINLNGDLRRDPSFVNFNRNIGNGLLTGKSKYNRDLRNESSFVNLNRSFCYYH